MTSPGTEAATRDRRAALLLGLAVFAILSALGHHTWGTVDAIRRLAVTRSIVESGTVVPPEIGPVKYAPLQPVLMLPTYLLGRLSARVVPGADPHQVGYRATAFLFTPVLVSLLCVTYRRTLRGAGLPDREIWLGLATLLFTTLLLPYSRLLFSEPLNALLVLLAASALAALARGGEAAVPLASVSALLFLNGAVFGPLAAAQVAAGALLARRTSGPRAARRVLGLGTAALAAALLAWGLYNRARYGGALRFGYEGEGFGGPLALGLSGLLVSIGRGLVIYSAPTVLALAGFLAFRKDPRWGPLKPVLVFYAAAAGAYLLLYAAWDSFEGGWCWGPRFLLPFVPVLHLAIPLLLLRARTWSAAAKAAVALPFVLGFAVNAAEDLGAWRAFEKAT
ncbi:MAG TPA: hypothetical protein PK598_16370, partial [Thermoanaerobaculia bacterium]|nr:hypothetical protein [Thermoanaerobaculia bacterium]